MSNVEFSLWLIGGTAAVALAVECVCYIAWRTFATAVCWIMGW